MKKLFLTTAIILGFAIGSNADDEAGLFLPGDGLHGIRGNADGTDTYFDDTEWDWQSHIVIPEPTVAVTLDEVDDNTAILDEPNGKTADVTLTRTLQAGGWNTLALPFSMDIPSGWTVKELSTTTLENGTLTLNFADAQSIVAGTPYLVWVTDAVANPTFNGVTVSNDVAPTETDYVDFIPTLGKTTITGDKESVLFLAAENKLKNPTSLPSDMKGFRAYFQLKDGSTARSFSLNLGDEATGIAEIENGKLNIENGVYDLQGRRMESSMFNIQSSMLKKGVYIVNGKKTIK